MEHRKHHGGYSWLFSKVLETSIQSIMNFVGKRSYRSDSQKDVHRDSYEYPSRVADLGIKYLDELQLIGNLGFVGLHE